MNDRQENLRPYRIMGLTLLQLMLLLGSLGIVATAVLNWIF